MHETTNKVEPIRLKESEDASRPVVVQPSDDDLFVVTGIQAIDGCRLGISIQVWLQELEAMRNYVSQWCAQRQDRIKLCFMAPRAGNVLLFVTPTGKMFDFELADELVDLNTHIIQTYRIGRIEVHQVPSDELDRFVELDHGRVVYARS